MKTKNNVSIYILGLMLVGIFIVGLLFIFPDKTEEKEEKLHEWTTFKQEHSCHLISVDYDRAKYGWLCADGITYYNRFAE